MKFSTLYEASKHKLSLTQQSRGFMYTEPSGAEIAVHVDAYIDRPGYAVGEHVTISLVVAPSKNDFGYGKSTKSAVNFEIIGFYATIGKFSTGFQRFNSAIVNKLLQGVHVAIEPLDRNKAYFIQEDQLELIIDAATNWKMDGSAKKLNIKDKTDMNIASVMKGMLNSEKVINMIAAVADKAEP
ncbi:hypothetical protein ABNavy71_064 [Acinetobacter phage AB-Navy71]|nr:hypothetical protein ABNavy71_064 [Acinetobacter phage AB-Navy71]